MICPILASCILVLIHPIMASTHRLRMGKPGSQIPVQSVGKANHADILFWGVGSFGMCQLPPHSGCPSVHYL
ncbi:hypothetical protein F4824DRAFT_477229, partial [Ustulina deusta]